MLKNMADYIGIMCVLLLCSGFFYFVSTDYFYVFEKMTDLSLVAWFAMFALWGGAFARYKRCHEEKGLMFASFVTLSAMCFELYRYFIYTGDSSFRLYIWGLLACELVVFVVAMCSAFLDEELCKAFRQSDKRKKDAAR